MARSGNFPHVLTADAGIKLAAGGGESSAQTSTGAPPVVAEEMER